MHVARHPYGAVTNFRGLLKPALRLAAAVERSVWAWRFAAAAFARNMLAALSRAAGPSPRGTSA